MKLVNEKGKLFGLVNLADLAVIVMIVAIIGVVAVKIGGETVSNAISEKTDCYVEVSIFGAQPRLYEEVVRQDLIGERCVSGNEYMDATVEAVWLEDYSESHPNSEGQLVTSVDPAKKEIIFLIKTQIPKDTPSPKIGSQELRAGKSYIVKTQTFECSGTIRRVDIGAYTGTKGE